MADQIVLAWTVDAAGTPLGPAEAAAALAAVPLYLNATADPVLGQFFGLTVASDATAVLGSTATRTLTLNMTAAAPPEAPPPFPCHPAIPVPPTPPYRLTRTETLGGSFFAATGSATVQTARPQGQTLTPGDTIQFAVQPGVEYIVLALTDDDITLTAPFTGKTANTNAFQVLLAPVTRVALYSTSDLDTDGIAATEPAMAAASGAREVTLTYDDSLGAGPFTVAVKLTGRRPTQVTLDAGSADIAEIIGLVVTDTGGFDNSVGQITLVELSEELPPLTANGVPTPDDFRGALTDEAQTLIGHALVYLPPSYFALSQQSASYPQLAGDFLVTTGSTRVVTTEDQTAVLAQGHVIAFAEQRVDKSPLQTRLVTYVVDEVAPRSITLTAPYTGIDTNATGGGGSQALEGNMGVKGNFGAKITEKATGAYLIEPSPAAPPTDDQLGSLLARFVNPATAGPPPAPPLNPATVVPAPTLLSNAFAQTLRLALAVPVTSEQIAFA